MVALFLTTTISCSQALGILNKIKSNNSISDFIKTELIATIRETIPTCPVIVKENGRRKSN